MLEQQQELIDKINRLNKLPHSILLTGEKGSEFDDICDFIARRYMLERIKLEEVNSNIVDNILSINVKTLYTIDANCLSEKDQNTILKLFEEPTVYAYIVLCYDGSNILLDTIVNRSYEFKMCKYSKEYLSALVTNNKDKDKILSICTTPGQISMANHTDIEALFKLCSNMLTSMQKANYQNALSIADKINFKDEYDKFDLNLFISALSYMMLTTGQTEMYSDVLRLNKKVWVVNDKKQQFEQFITQLWAKAHSLQLE